MADEIVRSREEQREISGQLSYSGPCLLKSPTFYLTILMASSENSPLYHLANDDSRILCNDWERLT